MLTVCSELHLRAPLLSLCQIICLCATWVQLTQALPQTGTGVYEPLHGVGLIPSEARSALIPSAPIKTQANPVGLIPSERPPPGLVPSQAFSMVPSTLALNPSSPLPPGSFATPLIPSASLPAGPGPSFSASATPDASLTDKLSRMDTTRPPAMISTDQGLHPIPPAATQSGDPNGHHEITEPNFSATGPCRGCAPAIEVTATGWLDTPPEDQHGTSTRPIVTRIAAGPSNVFISQAQSDGNFVIADSVTVIPGQTVTVDNVGVAIQTNAGTVEVVVGTVIIPLQPPSELTSYKAPHVTYAPTRLPPTLTIGTETLIANQQTQYVVAGQTLSPGGSAITVAGTTVSLSPSATAVTINGVSSSLIPDFGNIWTTTVPALTFNNNVYTANRAGYITIGPGTVLKPGGTAITVDGTILSLEHSGTAVVIQGSTSILQALTTVVTRTKSVGSGGVGDDSTGHTSGGTWPSPTGRIPVPVKPLSAGVSWSRSVVPLDGWVEGTMVLLWWSLGYLAVAL